MKTKVILIASVLVFTLTAAGKVAAVHVRHSMAAKAQGRMVLDPANDRHQALVDRHMSSEAALALEERKAVALVRTDLWQDEEQQRAAVRKIRRDYRAQAGTLTALHATEKKALD